MKHIFTLLVVLFIAVSGFSQDKILFVDGKEVEAKIDSVLDEVVIYTLPSGRKKYKSPLDIFSITYKDGKEDIFYKKNLLTGNDLSVPEAKNVVHGARYAKNNYTPILPTVGGFAIGLAAGNYGGFFWGSLGTIAGNIPFIVSRPRLPNKAQTDNENFVYGYRSTASSKKIFYNVLAGFAGTLTGALLKDSGTEFFD